MRLWLVPLIPDGTVLVRNLISVKPISRPSQPPRTSKKGDSAMLFDKLWDQVKGAERSGELTVEEALDCATRLPQALFCSMMECLAENGEDPEVVVVQAARLHEHILTRLRQFAASLRVRGGKLH